MLKSLYIYNFKGLKELVIPKIGNLNLIVGKNNSGKSSILEAIMLYASGGSELQLHELSTSHDEMTRLRIRPYENQSQDYNINSELRSSEEILPYEHLFYGRKFNSKESIYIGEKDKNSAGLTISYIKERKKVEEDKEKQNDTIRFLQQLKILNDDIAINNLTGSNVLDIRKGRYKHLIPLNESIRFGRHTDSDRRSKINFRHVPTKLNSMDELSYLWDQITLTPYEEMTINALKSIEKDISDIRFVLKDGSRRQRTAIIKLSGSNDVFPILSMGDGISRVLQLILNMYAAKDGVYLIDEFDNGLHYSIQKTLWDMIFRLSKKLNVQVFATTHSWDCIQSFAEASIDNDDLNGCLLKLGKSKLSANKGKSIVTVFDESQLTTITQEMVEVR